MARTQYHDCDERCDLSDPQDDWGTDSFLSAVSKQSTGSNGEGLERSREGFLVRHGFYLSSSW